MKNIIFIISCFLSITVTAQEKGTYFQKFENWQEVLAKAKAENKTIFVDAYATWCAPCKKMDADVYTDPKVAAYVNEYFIAIKVQMDKTRNDPSSIKKWYTQVSKLQKKYSIDAMPTFLFLNAAGDQVYRGLGYQDAEAFLAVLKKANDSLENYSLKARHFKKGKLRRQDLLLFALQAKKYHDDNLAFQVASEYKKNVIDQVEPMKVLNPQFLDYLASFGSLINVNDPIARFMYDNPQKSDSLLKKNGAANSVFNYLVSKDILEPTLLKDGKIISEVPDWAGLENRIATSYNEKLGKRLIVGYKISWHQAKKDWEHVVKYSIERQELSGIDTTIMGKASLNNLVYYVILKYTSNPIYLNKGLGYMEIALKNNQTDYAAQDTYANLLYKLNRKDDALKAENKALYFAEQQKDIDVTKICRETLERMKNNLPIIIE